MSTPLFARIWPASVSCAVIMVLRIGMSVLQVKSCQLLPLCVILVKKRFSSHLVTRITARRKVIVGLIQSVVDVAVLSPNDKRQSQRF